MMNFAGGAILAHQVEAWRSGLCDAETAQGEVFHCGVGFGFHHADVAGRATHEVERNQAAFLRNVGDGLVHVVGAIGILVEQFAAIRLVGGGGQSRHVLRSGKDLLATTSRL